MNSDEGPNFNFKFAEFRTYGSHEWYIGPTKLSVFSNIQTHTKTTCVDSYRVCLNTAY